VAGVLTRGLVLHTFAYGETSRILRILTPDLGMRSVIAKGARRPGSRLGPVLDPFTEGEFQLHIREGRDLSLLSGFTLIRSRQEIGRNLFRFASASLLAEIVLRLGTEEPQPEYFAGIVGLLDRLASPGEAAWVPLSTIWTLVGSLGYRPELSACVHCGRIFGDAETTRFDPDSGGSVCRVCRPSDRLIDAETRLQVAEMSDDRAPQALHNRKLHADLLQAFLAAHVAPDRPLRSLPLFLDQIR